MSLSTSQVSNTRVLISKIPEGVAPNKTHFETVTQVEDVPVLKENEIFVKNIIFSMEPYIRLDDFSDTVQKSRIVGYAIAKVIDSKNPAFPVGATVFSSSEWGQYSHIFLPQYLKDVTRIDEMVDPNLPISVYNGVLGVGGFTSWDALQKIGDLKTGETIYVSSAAGTLGQLAGQLAKRKGLRVIGSAGTDAKVQFLLDELGFDAAFNYKTQDKRAALTAAVGEAGLDIYFDLVGDDTVEIALDLLNPHGRVLAVGILAWHQNAKPHVPTNMINILYKQLRYEGYTVFDRHDVFPQFLQEVGPLVADGSIKYTDTLLHDGVETLGQTYVDLLGGKYTGKVSVQIAEF
ncbi:hypothetical protein BGZ52_002203 [Haplosporangium bisporale]|nr:hypothetical protein BGZ52_002203 [Haplosporangium bisporale]